MNPTTTLSRELSWGRSSISVQFCSVQSLSRVRFFATPWTAAGQASQSTTNSWILHKLMSTESVMPSKHLILYTMLSRLVIAFLSRSKHLLISWLQSPDGADAVILEPKKINSVSASNVSLSICHEVMGLDAMILILWMLSFKLAFSLSLLKSTIIQYRWQLLYPLPKLWAATHSPSV